MGFCLINNAVVAARHAQQLGKAQVLIVDWDVHHGNGTQALVERDASLRYVSMHQYPWYPGTGAEDERGVGNVFNVPRPPGLPRQVYARDLLAAVDAALEGWPPDLLLVSAGFDSLNGDPLGGFTLEPEDMARWTALLRERVAPAPVVGDRKSTRLNSSHLVISYAVFCLKKKKIKIVRERGHVCMCKYLF